MNKSHILILALILVALLVLGVIFTQPFVVYRLTTKAFTGYEIYLLKYPNSQLAEKKTTATSKITMATDYTFYSSDNIDVVLEYMEHRQSGFVPWQGWWMTDEPGFRNSVCASETTFQGIFQALEKGTPCIETYIYPSSTGSGTMVKIRTNWPSMGLPDWLRGL